MTQLSLGISPCPNDVFIFSGLLLNEVSINGYSLQTNYLDIETLNEKANHQEFDIVKISYANFPRCAANYNLLTAGGALGRGVGPLLLSHNGKWNPDHEVLVPGQFTTANFLLDFWAKHQLKKRFVPFNVLYDHLCQTPDTQGVVIHEKRFTYVQDNLSLIQDLGTYWEEQTGYPIPLGAILTRKNLDTQSITSAIQQSLHWAYANCDRAFALCQQYASDLTPAVIQSHIDLYVNDFSYDLGTEGQKAVEFFLKLQEPSTVY